MIAGTWFDRVLGLDIHVVGIPTPPSPVPVQTPACVPATTPLEKSHPTR
jgi:hypothetical protein